MSEPKHPGRVLFVDGNTQEVIREADAAELPPSIAFVELDGRLEPVVRIVSYTTDSQRIIRQYGADGALLLSTVQLRQGQG
jgi:hypothetical protein